MISYQKKRHTMTEVLSQMDPAIQKWFRSKFKDLTEPQAYAIPLIEAKNNVLISSPTGSGKTISAFLAIIDRLYKLHREGKLEDKIYCVYVSPLKALANDINRNLKEPLREIGEVVAQMGGERPPIRVAVRSGDTSTAERQKMVRKPPHIFITTPESLSLVLSTSKFIQRFTDAEYLIIDEIHDLCNSKRGILLSLAVERLQHLIKRPLVRVGLSATQAPIEEVAKYLVGYEEGKLRDCSIVDIESTKGLDIAVVPPVEDLSKTPFEVAQGRMYLVLKRLIEEHKTTLVFTNTRSGTEHMVIKLKELGVKRVAAHHGSMAKDIRLEIEEQLKRGELQASVSSTSLELGIDIGFIDLVCQISSPKSTAKLLQRIGRAGHAVSSISKGRLIPMDPEDLVECGVLVKSAYANKIDRVRILENNLDVLAQALVGMAIDHQWDVEEAFTVVRRAMPFHQLPRKDFDAVLDYLGGRHTLQDKSVYAKIWIDPQQNKFGAKRGSRMIYFMNIGTIPEESNYRVFSERGVPLGTLSESFVERLGAKEIFVLGGKSYEFLQTKGTKVFVRDAHGRKPTVPSWSGEMMSRTFDLSLQIGEFRRWMDESIGEKTTLKIKDEIMKTMHMDMPAAETVIRFFKDQKKIGGVVPHDRAILVEGYIDGRGVHNVIFHSIFGRSVNEALSRYLAYKIQLKSGFKIQASVTDNNFLLALPEVIDLKEVAKMVSAADFDDVLRASLPNSEIFKQRFRHCATRAFMILKNYRGKEISIARQHQHARKILDALASDPEFPIVKETYNEVLHEFLDVDDARDVVADIDAGKVTFAFRDWSQIPSPFALNVILMGMTDLLTLEDRTALLKELQDSILTKVVEGGETEAPKFERERVDRYFASKKELLRFSSKGEMLEALEKLGAVHAFKYARPSLYEFTSSAPDAIAKWADDLLKEGRIESVWIQDRMWIPSSLARRFSAVYRHAGALSPSEKRTLDLLGAGKTPDQLKAALEGLEDAFDEDEEVIAADILRSLETKNLVRVAGATEDGSFIFRARAAGDRADFETAVKGIVVAYLEYFAPVTRGRLAYDLSLDEEVLSLGLTALLKEGKVAEGYYVVGERPQYMLTEDKKGIEGQVEGAVLLDENMVIQHIIAKQFEKFETIDDYFEVFMSAGLVYDVFSRVKKFDIEDWWDRREREEVRHGRFVRRQVGFAHDKYADMLASAYRQEAPLRTDEKALEAIRDSGGVTASQLGKKLRLPKEHVQEIIDRLDRNMYICRKAEERKSWSSRNVYIPYPVRQIVKDAKRRVILQFLKSSGPASFTAIRGFTGFSFNEVFSILNKLEEEEVAKRVTVVGETSIDMYILTDELAELVKAPAQDEVHDRLRILSLYDPFVQPMWAELTTKYGEGWIYPVIKDGELVGMIEKWKMSGAVDIRAVMLEDESVLPELLDELDRMMEFYKMMGIEILRIRKVFETPIEELDEGVLDVFRSKGYHVLQGMLIKGALIPQVFQRKDVYAYLLWKQHIHPDNKVRDVLRLAQKFGGIRSDFESYLRVQRFRRLRRHLRDNELMAGLVIPAHLTYCLKSDLRLYKKAKSRPLTGPMRQLMEQLPKFDAVSRKELFERVEMDPKDFDEAFNALYEGLFVVRNGQNKYLRIGDAVETQEQARRIILERLVTNFGLVSAEGLARMTKHEFRMHEIRDYLSEQEKGGRLVKGFFIEGDETLYWMIAADVLSIGKVVCGESFVLSPFDQLALFLAAEIRRRFRIGSCFVIFNKGEMAGAFKGTKKGNTLLLSQFVGTEGEKEVLRAFERQWGLRVTEQEEGEQQDDWEIMRFWEEQAY
ncbi:MAG TPA: ATP-dependent helicase [Candidatus Thermoplasmatota archaeon]|nr:ATP-dependent helicase [Candidatus Thermoplasmatota archaeon]